MLRFRSILAPFAALLLSGAVAASCSQNRTETEEPSDPAGTAVLALNVSATDLSEESAPLLSQEMMHSLRLIVLDSEGYAEHNILLDLSDAPCMTKEIAEFKVKAPDTKTVILVANEAGAAIMRPDGVRIPAGEYFGAISATAGQFVDLAEIRSLLIARSDISLPLPMTEVHTVTIGREPYIYRRLPIVRAASKYTFHITNTDPRNSRTIDAVSLSHAARRSLFFPPPGASGTADAGGEDVLSVECGLTVGPGATLDLAPIYVGEGLSAPETEPYAAGLTVDGKDLGLKPLEWSAPDTPESVSLMTDLPRNTHVVVNIRLTMTDFSIRYTVCPWNQETIDVPSFD